MPKPSPWGQPEGQTGVTSLSEVEKLVLQAIAPGTLMPFEAIAEDVNVLEDDVVSAIRSLIDKGLVIRGRDEEGTHYKLSLAGRKVQRRIVAPRPARPSGLGEHQYREFLGERIEGETGSLSGEGKGLFSLDTPSLEKLYEALKHSNPQHDFERQL